MTHSNERHYQRIGFRTEAGILVGGTRYPGELIDLALQGALFKVDEDFPLQLGDTADLAIFLPDSDISLNFHAELIHHRGDYFGFLFISEDADTMGHLRRLLELNSGDAGLVEQEFSHWLQNPPVQR